MTKILAHICKEKTYLPLLQNLTSKVEIASGSLHETIFDTYQKYAPDVVLLPIHEYTQEFHEFVNTFKNQTQIIIFAGSLTDNDVIKYCDQHNIKTICKNKIGTNTLTYEYLYDSDMFYNLNLSRTDKILTILSGNNDYNHKMLDDMLYPNSMLKLFLINNSNFKHAQNIGLAEFEDLALLMNHYSYAIDLTGLYYAELQACNMKTIKVDDSIRFNIENNIYVEKDPNLSEYTIEKFVVDRLIPFINEIRSK